MQYHGYLFSKTRPPREFVCVGFPNASGYERPWAYFPLINVWYYFSPITRSWLIKTETEVPAEFKASLLLLPKE